MFESLSEVDALVDLRKFIFQLGKPVHPGLREERTSPPPLHFSPIHSYFLFGVGQSVCPRIAFRTAARASFLRSATLQILLLTLAASVVSRDMCKKQITGLYQGTNSIMGEHRTRSEARSASSYPCFGAHDLDY